MTKTLRDQKTGQYAGSIGNGKTKTPTPQGFIAKRRAEKEEAKTQSALEEARRIYENNLYKNVADHVLEKAETTDNVKLPSGLGTFLYVRLYSQLKNKGYKIVDLKMGGAYTIDTGEHFPYNPEQIKLLKELYYSLDNEHPGANIQRILPGNWYLRGVIFEKDGRTITAETGENYFPNGVTIK